METLSVSKEDLKAMLTRCVEDALIKKKQLKKDNQYPEEVKTLNEIRKKESDIRKKAFLKWYVDFGGKEQIKTIRQARFQAGTLTQSLELIFEDNKKLQNKIFSNFMNMKYLLAKIRSDVRDLWGESEGNNDFEDSSLVLTALVINCVKELYERDDIEGVLGILICPSIGSPHSFCSKDLSNLTKEKKTCAQIIPVKSKKITQGKITAKAKLAMIDKLSKTVVFKGKKRMSKKEMQNELERNTSLRQVSRMMKKEKVSKICVIQKSEVIKIESCSQDAKTQEFMRKTLQLSIMEAKSEALLISERAMTKGLQSKDNLKRLVKCMICQSLINKEIVINAKSASSHLKSHKSYNSIDHKNKETMRILFKTVQFNGKAASTKDS